MKILQVIPFFAPKYGGTVNSTYILSKELSKAGHEVTILTTDIDKDEKYVESIIKKGVNVICLHSVYNLGLLIYSPSIKNWLDTNLKDFDIIHMHNFRSYQNNVVRTYAKKYNIPYILQARGSVLPFFQKQNFKKIYDFIWGYKILNDAKMVIALTNGELKQYQQMGVRSDKIKIIPNGIDLSEYQLLPARGKFRKKYGIKTDENVILFLGRINKIKGIDLLINSFSDISKELDMVKLVIVGPDDGFLNYIKQMIIDLKLSDKVIITGPLYNKAKLEAYVDADVYVLSSRYETFPNTVLESLVCVTPVVMTKNCGIADIIDKNGGIVADHDIQHLKQAIITLLTNKKLRSKYAKNGRRIVETKFDWLNIIKNLERIYMDILNR
ncbi:glycosyltransferase [Methanobacterium sp. BAmetb5]|uniref:glycosyltransferase n=1 Tax=Methanobacterium sp. BAmetb5 TaxID=2025351 RepID=UPI000E9B3F51|nr:glycosyltransferase [Methanobacterium sp. BAmetb5]AXV38911.1 MAG: hypothetical protein CIT02_00590 [Methanobacterium sp. BAmetb5]